MTERQLSAYDSFKQVFVRLKAPFVKLGKSTGSTLMRRRLTRAGVDHVARDGKSFHALRRTAALSERSVPASAVRSRDLGTVSVAMKKSPLVAS